MNLHGFECEDTKYVELEVSFVLLFVAKVDRLLVVDDASRHSGRLSFVTA